ncbi:Glutamate/aspartate import solute-binding protein [Pandoraea horticolens]|uniref:Glutamate/aspartate import solute-binding protein n=1 Tax=Pandoraea horticolens TaxID=2508298 RepID=A0A5E4WN37_9BURK|nr:transporter substrate-binding domain-containing protein [Pandoraea horticolens]VVE25239.1 Glutamate/aspartate import solute-binding protein [Pandoraea horticolens]
MNGFKEVNWKGVAKHAALGLTVWLAAQAAISTAIAANTKADTPVTPQNRIPLVKNGTVDLDCAPNTITPERAEQVGFSNPYYVSEVRLLVNKKDNIRGLDDLKGQNLVASAGSTGERLARLQAEKGGFRVIPARDHGESIMTLETGRAKASALDDVLLASLRATAREPGDFAIVGAPLETELNAPMLRRDDPQFKRFVDTTLAHVFSSGEIRRIQRK